MWPEALSDQISLLADVVLEAAVRYAWRDIAKRHREVPRFAVIGYGKLGGKELGYGSDLDLIFLYDDPDPDAGELYARLGRKLSTWLTAATPAGVLYDIDLRLRPTVRRACWSVRSKPLPATRPTRPGCGNTVR